MQLNLNRITSAYHPKVSTIITFRAGNKASVVTRQFQLFHYLFSHTPFSRQMDLQRDSTRPSTDALQSSAMTITPTDKINTVLMGYRASSQISTKHSPYFSSRKCDFLLMRRSCQHLPIQMVSLKQTWSR